MRLRRRPRSAGPIIGLVLPAARGAKERRRRLWHRGVHRCGARPPGQLGGSKEGGRRRSCSRWRRAGPARPARRQAGSGGGRGRGLASWPGPAVGVVEVCRRSRRLDLLGLTRTMLSDEAASLLAGALNTLPDRD